MTLCQYRYRPIISLYISKEIDMSQGNVCVAPEFEHAYNFVKDVFFRSQHFLLSWLYHVDTNNHHTKDHTITENFRGKANLIMCNKKQAKTKHTAKLTHTSLYCSEKKTCQSKLF